MLIQFLIMLILKSIKHCRMHTTILEKRQKFITISINAIHSGRSAFPRQKNGTPARMVADGNPRWVFAEASRYREILAEIIEDRLEESKRSIR